ncbi:hypothetical protein MUK42_28692 [Musa troglodytarum]|uniref:Uncharacterized protein n=1 Tax=Musa troglodytarum TaxID=320322 RepID=A0A9E7JUL0_9LILI|nr:hypothetical protein MUK42_28692 [Musa troglodytarum]
MEKSVGSLNDLLQTNKLLSKKKISKPMNRYLQRPLAPNPITTTTPDHNINGVRINREMRIDI